LFWTCYLGLGLVCFGLELAKPAHPISYKKGLPLDVVAMLAYQFVMFPIAFRATTWFHLHYSSFVYDIPLAVRVVVYYLGADLGSYWFHRLMHTRHVWRIHRFHHSATQLYWLAGARATIPQQILFNLPVAFGLPLIADAPVTVLEALVLATIATNDWMHINVAWRSNWLEKIFVTPRYHHIHHSTNAKQHEGNFGVVFSVWDRLFGTYLDPDTTSPKKFGTGEPKQRDPMLLMIGV
jgi:sterol desaturase/sphingolipid hydroxylase (fatty acid hydroxylase superfamily)